MSQQTLTAPAPPRRPNGLDAGSQALAEALRSSFAIIKVVMVVLVAVFLLSGFFTVGPQEKAILLRFGHPVGEGEKALLGAGAHWAFPYPIDEVVRVPITELQQVRSSVGWFFQTPEQEALGQEPPAGPSLNPAVDSYALTADGNIVHVRATLSYRIQDPVRYVFGFVNVSNAVQSALDNALLATAARFGVDDLLTRDRLGFQEAVRRRVEQLIAAQDLGIVVEQCSVVSRPPRQVTQAFQNVIAAGQNRDRLLNEARSEASQTLSRAEAEAAGRLETARAERSRLIASVRSDAETFSRLLPLYQANPGLFVQQWLVETMSRALPSVQEKILLSARDDGQTRELRLLLNRELPKPKTETTR